MLWAYGEQKLSLFSSKELRSYIGRIKDPVIMSMFRPKVAEQVLKYKVWFQVDKPLKNRFFFFFLMRSVHTEKVRRKGSVRISGVEESDVEGTAGRRRTVSEGPWGGRVIWELKGIPVSFRIALSFYRSRK